MKPYEEICRECHQDLLALHIPVLPIETITFTINTRAKKRWGQCRLHPDGTATISINSRLVGENGSENGLRSVILHELLHTCPNCANHGYYWQFYAGIVNEVLGLSVERTSSAQKLGVPALESDRKIRKSEYKYVAICQKCGQRNYRTRRSALILSPQNYVCSSCGGPFQVYKLVRPDKDKTES